MRKEKKEEIINALCEEVKAYPHLYIADIGGLNSEQTSDLRRAAFRAEVKMTVVKNTLLIKALERTGLDYSEIYPALKGESCIMLSNVNNAPAKLIKGYLEKNKKATKPELKGAYVEESFYLGKENLDLLVNIKSKNELIADVVAMLQSPMQNLLSGLQGAGSTICGVLKTLSEKEEA